jgi:hypothetical protein
MFGSLVLSKVKQIYRFDCNAVAVRLHLFVTVNFAAEVGKVSPKARWDRRVGVDASLRGMCGARG